MRCAQCSQRMPRPSEPSKIALIDFSRMKRRGASLPRQNHKRAIKKMVQLQCWAAGSSSASYAINEKPYGTPMVFLIRRLSLWRTWNNFLSEFVSC
jgi:hypothetical protein